MIRNTYLPNGELATILQINNRFLFSIRLKIAAAYLSVIAVGFFALLFFVMRNYEQVELANKTENFRRYALETAEYISSDYNNTDANIRMNVAYRIQEQGKSIKASEDGQPARILVLDYNGIVQYDSYNDLSEQALLQRNLFDYPAVRNVLTGTEMDPTVLYNKSEDWWRLYSYAAVTNSESAITGMVIISTSLSDVEARLQSINRNLIYYFLVISFCVLALSILVSETITRPIQRLHIGIRRMAQGQLDQRVHVHGRDEVAQLGEAFNAMAEQLENLDQARNEFVSNASHELRTPLSAIKVLSQSLQHSGDALPPVYVEFLQDIGDEIDRLDHIIEDLLKLVALDAPEVKVVRQQLDIADMLGRIVDQLVPLAQQKDITLEYMESECLYYGDGDKLYQVFFNLIHNAIKYTPEGGKVWVGIQHSDTQVEIRVLDSGIGIEPKEIPHIFERFYRVDKARSRATGGTGLGLSIAYKIVQQHGGRIDVESEPGKGSVFIVMLPVREEDMQNVKQQ